MSTILVFNPFGHASQQMGTKVKLQVRSLERTLRMLLLNTLRRYILEIVNPIT